MIPALLISALLLAAASRDDDDSWRTAMLDGMAAAGQADYARAEQAMMRALRLAEAFGPMDSRVGSVFNSLGLVYRAEHKYSEAENAYRRALPVMEAVYGRSIDVANVSFNMAAVILESGRPADAMENLTRSLAIYQRLLGDSSLKAASVLCLEGDALRAMKRYEEAEMSFHRCADIREKDSGIEDPGFADALLGLARVLTAEGKATAAEARYQIVDKVRERTSGITSPLLAESLEEHAAVLKTLARDKDADRLLTISAAIRKLEPQRQRK